MQNPFVYAPQGQKGHTNNPNELGFMPFINGNASFPSTFTMKLTADEILDYHLFYAYWSTLEQIISSYRNQRLSKKCFKSQDNDTELKSVFMDVIKALYQYAEWEGDGLDDCFAKSK